MNRRHLLKGMGLITLYGSFPAIVSEFLVSCNAPEKKLRAGFFSDDEFAGIEMLLDTMLPKTATVGALNTHVPYFIDLVAKNCMTGADQQMLKDGLQQLCRLGHQGHHRPVPVRGTPGDLLCHHSREGTHLHHGLP